MAHETSSGAECDAKLVRISMNEKSRIHKKRADTPTIKYENFSERTYVQAVEFDYLLPPKQSETLNIDQSVEVGKSTSKYSLLRDLY